MYNFLPCYFSQDISDLLPFFLFPLPSLQSLLGCINNNISRNIYPAKANPAVLGSMTKTDISKGLGNFPSKIRQEDLTSYNKPS